MQSVMFLQDLQILNISNMKYDKQYKKNTKCNGKYARSHSSINLRWTCSSGGGSETSKGQGGESRICYFHNYEHKLNGAFRLKTYNYSVIFR